MAKNSKRNAVIAGGGLALLLLVAVGFAGEEDEDDNDDVEPGSPGGQDPPPTDEPTFTVYTGTTDFDDVEPATPDIPWAPFTAPGEKPWNPQVYEHPSNYPTPGKFHQIVSGDIFGGKGSAHNMAWAALYEAAYTAAVEYGDGDDADARAFAKSIAEKGANRAKYRDLIQCSYWNDLVYGTWGYGSKSKAGPHGRAIRLMPYHADNRDRIFSMAAPVRNIKMRTPSDKGKGNGGAIDAEYREGFEYLWFPALNLSELYESRKITAEGTAWEDGSSKMNPPPEIWALGVDMLEDPGLASYGCLEGEQAST